MNKRSILVNLCCATALMLGSVTSGFCQSKTLHFVEYLNEGVEVANGVKAVDVASDPVGCFWFALRSFWNRAEGDLAPIR